jgi:surface antigen
MRKALLVAVFAAFCAFWSLPASAIQCVPYAREVSGLELKGDAWQWWNAAAGKYDRGRAPLEGGVLVFARQGKMNHGHVSVVTQVVSNRVILVDHANWAPVRTRGRGSVTTNVPVVDVSAANDWSKVRVWYDAIRDYGHRVYNTQGFISKPIPKASVRKASLTVTAPAKPAEILPKNEPAIAQAEPQSPAVSAAHVVKVSEEPSLVKTAKALFRRSGPDVLPFN